MSNAQKFNSAVIRKSKKVAGSFTLYVNGAPAGIKANLEEAIEAATSRSVPVENIKLPRGVEANG
jgi:hypothetical protein